jgi:hypothetical protein
VWRQGSNLRDLRTSSSSASAVRHIQDEVPGRERSAGRIGGDGGRSGLAPGPRRPGNRADELSAVLTAPETAFVPLAGRRRSRDAVRRSVVVSGDTAEEFLLRRGPCSVRTGHRRKTGLGSALKEGFSG